VTCSSDSNKTEKSGYVALFLVIHSLIYSVKNNALHNPVSKHVLRKSSRTYFEGSKLGFLSRTIDANSLLQKKRS
jgi:hypothetical protein